jgi:hypothetical protein
MYVCSGIGRERESAVRSGGALWHREGERELGRESESEGGRARAREGERERALSLSLNLPPYAAWEMLCIFLN